MANQMLGSDVIVRLNDFLLLGLVQSVDWSVNFNAQDIFELGSDAKAATSMEIETTGSLSIQSQGGTAGLLARSIVKRNASGVFTGYEFAIGGASGKNGYTWTHSSLREAQFDLTIHQKSDQTNFDRSVVLPRCYITSIAGRADASGTASETINFGGDFVVGLPTPFHDVRCIPCINTGGKLDMGDASVTSTTHILAYCYVDERRIRTIADGGVSAALDASGGLITLTGLTLSNYPNMIGRAIVVKKTPSTTFPAIGAATSGSATAGAASTLTDSAAAWTINAYTNYNVRITAGTGIGQVRNIASNTATVLTVSATWTTNPDATSKYTIYQRDTSQFYVRGNQVNMYIAPASASSPQVSEQWLKCQSVDFNIDMRSEVLRQLAFNLAGTSAYCRIPTYPLNISANVTVFEADWKDWKAMLSPTAKTFPGGTSDVYNNSYDFSPASLKENFNIVIEYLTATGTVMQSWRFTDQRPDGQGSRVSAGARSEISWSFRGTAFQLVGTNA